MKTLLFCSLIVLSFTQILLAQNEDGHNVLSYYAASNSLDGQILLGESNVIRFYPVFIYRDSTTSVRITVYYGSHRFTKGAVKEADGTFWEAHLPLFGLGDAIQRLDFETRIGLQKDSVILKLQNRIDTLTQEGSTFETSVRAALLDIATHYEKGGALVEGAIANLAPVLTDAAVRAQLTAAIGDTVHCPVLPLISPQVATALKEASDTVLARKIADGITLQLRQAENSFTIDRSKAEKKFDEMANSFLKLNTLQADIKRTFASVITGFTSGTKDSISAILRQVLGGAAGMAQIRDTMRSYVLRKLHDGVADTNLSGTSVRLSDIIISDDLGEVRLLYRNHKTALRRMAALDPAEKLGPFRARFVPFVITGDDQQILKLRPIAGDNASAVFEIGLGFNNVSYPGDDFVPSELSIDRVGIAFAVTPDLFSSNASVKALAITYDFNAYASVSVGANFAHDTRTPYIGYGINKTAFEFILSKLAGLFGG